MCCQSLSYRFQKGQNIALNNFIFSISSFKVMPEIFLTTNACNTALVPPDVDFSTPYKSLSLPQRREVTWPDGVTQVKSSTV